MGKSGKLLVALMLVVFLTGLIMRVYYFNATDMNGLEITKVSKIEDIGAKIYYNSYEAVAFALIVFASLFIVWKRKSPLLLAIFFLLFYLSNIVDRLFSLAYATIFNPHPPLFNILVGLIQVFWRLFIENHILPGEYDLHAIGATLSFISTVVTPFIAYFFCLKVWGKTTAYIAFLLLMLSPYMIFFSGFAGHTEPATLLTYLALLLFVIALKEGNKDYFFLSGLTFSVGISMRYTVLFVFPIFFILYILRGRISSQHISRKDLSIFLIFLFGTVLIYSENIIDTYKHMDRLNNEKIDSHMYPRDVPRFSSFFLDYFGESPIRNQPLLNVRLINLFYSPVILIVLLVGLAYSITSKDLILQVFGILFVGYFTYHSFMVDQMIRYFNDLVFPVAIISARTIGLVIERYIEKKKILLVAFTILFLIFSVQTSSNLLSKPFKGLTNLMAEFETLNNPSFLINDNVLTYYLLQSDIDEMSYEWKNNPDEFAGRVRENSFDFIILTPVFDRHISFEEFNEEFFEKEGYVKYEDLSTGDYLVYEVYKKK